MSGFFLRYGTDKNWKNWKNTWIQRASKSAY